MCEHHCELAPGAAEGRPAVNLRRRNQNTPEFHIMYVSVNSVAAGKRARTRDSMASIRRVFLEADHDADGGP